MNTDDLFTAMSDIEDSYLISSDASAQPAVRRKKIIRRALLAAAVLVLCIATVTAGVNLLSIGSEKVGADSYNLYFEENPAAADAPKTIAAYYLPTVGGLAQNYGTLSNIIVHLDCQNTAGAQVTFTQRPLLALDYNNTFAGSNGIDIDSMKQETVTFGAVEYFRLTHKSGSDTSAFYYWVDEARHYVFEMFFNEGISEDDRIAYLQSVHPVGLPEVLQALQMDALSLWLPDGTTESLTLYTGRDGQANMCAAFAVSPVRTLNVEQGDLYTPMENSTLSTRTVDGTEIKIYRFMWAEADTVSESWVFPAPDGKSTITLFFDAHESDFFTLEEQEAIFRSLHAVTDIAPYLNKP